MPRRFWVVHSPQTASPFVPIACPGVVPRRGTRKAEPREEGNRGGEEDEGGEVVAIEDTNQEREREREKRAGTRTDRQTDLGFHRHRHRHRHRHPHRHHAIPLATGTPLLRGTHGAFKDPYLDFWNRTSELRLGWGEGRGAQSAGTGRWTPVGTRRTRIIYVAGGRFVRYGGWCFVGRCWGWELGAEGRGTKGWGRSVQGLEGDQGDRGGGFGVELAVVGGGAAVVVVSGRSGW
ncbi:hypothetical protein M758_6G069300 [Ceratodon purpureus]|nr:hypothetical protein M758_6G069300 [Ceratodon purpureus]